MREPLNHSLFAPLNEKIIFIILRANTIKLILYRCIHNLTQIYPNIHRIYLNRLFLCLRLCIIEDYRVS